MKSTHPAMLAPYPAAARAWNASARRRLRALHLALAGGCLGLALPAAPAAAQSAGVPRMTGTEFRVNIYTQSDQRAPAIAMDADGDFAVTWTSAVEDGSGTGVYLRRYDRAGNPRSSEVRVNSFTRGDQRESAVAMDPAGNMVVVWESIDQDGNLGGIYGQRYSADGSRRGNEFRINATTAGDQRYPQVAMARNGAFVVTWQSATGSRFGFSEIRARLFDPNGNPVGNETRVNTSTVGFPLYPAAAMDADGDFVVTWQTFFGANDNSKSGVQARRFNRSGQPLGNQFEVNVTSNNRQSNPSVAMDLNGNFLIAWQSKKQEQNSNGGSIYARRFDAAGRPLSTEFLVNTFTALYQRLPVVVMDDDGDALITWESYGQEGSTGGFGIYAQRYTQTGTRSGGEFRVNTFTAGDQRTPAVAMDAAGNFAVTWESGPSSQGRVAETSSQDRSGLGVFAQRFGGSTGQVPGGNVVADPVFQVMPAYPNPFADQLRIPVSLSDEGTLTTEVFDLLGRRVAQRPTMALGTGQRDLFLDGTGLAGGVYFVRLTFSALNGTRVERTIQVTVMR